MKGKKKLLFVGHSSELLGGAEDEYQKILEYLSKYSNLYEVDAIFPDGKRVEEFAKYCFRYQTYDRFFLPASRRHIIEYYGYLKSYFQQKKIVNSFIKDVNYDICLVNTSVMLWFVRILKKRKIKLIIFVRETIKPNFLRKLLYRYYSHAANYLIFVNNRNRCEYEEISGKNNAVTLYYSIKDIKSSPQIDLLKALVGDKLFNVLLNKDLFKLMISGSIYEVKNQIMAVRVLREMRESNYKLPYIIIAGNSAGNDKYFQKLNNSIAKYNLNEYFYFTGYINKDVYYKLFELIDALLITSLDEGCPLVLFEAMKFNKIIVSTKVGGVEDLIEDDVNGFIAKNEKEMAEKINVIMNNPQLKNNYEINANRLYSEKFSNNNIYGKYLEIMNKIIDNQW